MLLFSIPAPHGEVEVSLPIMKIAPLQRAIPSPGLPVSYMALHQQSEHTAISCICLRKLITLHFHMIYEVPLPGLACELRSFPAPVVHGEATQGGLVVLPPLVFHQGLAGKHCPW